MAAAENLSGTVGKKSACEALQVPRATFYRRQRPSARPKKQRPAPPLALTEQERKMVIDTLHSDRFCDLSPYQVYAQLLDDGQYMCGIRTMYRILHAVDGDVKERRRQVEHRHYSKPELLATDPNQVWSWDITKLKGPVKWTYYYLYVIMDIFSRYVVGWMIAQRELGALAKRLIKDTCGKQQIEPDQLIIHSDRGPSMTSKPVALLLSDLGVTKSHNRPYVSNDNPYSEAHFKTLKYCPQFPGRFGSIQDARSFCQQFFSWYNKEHRHSGIGLMTPEQVHYGLARKVYEDRCQVLRSAYEKNPERFKGKVPKPHALPKAAWINKPKSEELESNLLTAVSHSH
jgi:putative transposase